MSTGPKPGDGPEPRTRPVRVWDAPTRLFHWALVVCLAGSWWTAENREWERHLLFGYGVLGLVLFRLAWGLVGSETARFRTFLKGPGAALAHLRALVLSGPLKHEVGHNAAGGYAIALLLLLLSIQVGSGLFLAGGDIFLVEAPLYRFISARMEARLEVVHETVFDLLLILVAVHVLAVLAYWGLKRRNLIGPMLTGRMKLPEGAHPPRMESPWRAFILAGIIAAAVWAMVNLL